MNNEKVGKPLRTFVTIGTFDCETYDGIMDECNETEISKCSKNELNQIVWVLSELQEYFESLIRDKLLEESFANGYDKGFKEGKLVAIESGEELIM